MKQGDICEIFVTLEFLLRSFNKGFDDLFDKGIANPFT